MIATALKPIIYTNICTNWTNWHAFPWIFCFVLFLFFLMFFLCLLRCGHEKGVSLFPHVIALSSGPWSPFSSTSSDIQIIVYPFHFISGFPWHIDSLCGVSHTYGVWYNKKKEIILFYLALAAHCQIDWDHITQFFLINFFVGIQFDMSDMHIFLFFFEKKYFCTNWG